LAASRNQGGAARLLRMETVPSGPPWRSNGALLIAAAALVLAVLWLGPLTGMARRSFAWHMILHLAVTSVAGPLLALGFVARLPASGIGRRPLVLGLVASAAEMAVVWGWHLPPLHEWAALGDAAFALQQASFLLGGMLVWLVAFGDRSRAATAAGVLVMLLTFVHMTMLGMLLAFAPTLIYSPVVCQGSFGLGPLDDQRLGGALMAAAGGLPYLVGGLALAARLLRPTGLSADAPNPAGRRAG
jgi:putative membrane protein